MQGQLFSQDFLTHGILEVQPWHDLNDTQFAVFNQTLSSIMGGGLSQAKLNEAQTEALVINKVLAALGWANLSLPQVNSDVKGREAVPDLLLFGSAAQFAKATSEQHDDRRYKHGLAILEAKRWGRPLDRGDQAEAFDPDAPSSQMLRYLSRVDVASDRAVKWGMLTNGAVWRLYWQDARSRSEEFFEVNLAAALGLAGATPTHEAADPVAPQHALKLFYLLFHREAFLPQAWDSVTPNRTLHAYALNAARSYEEKVSQDLGSRVFNDIFPQLADALARGDLQSKDNTHRIGYGSFTRQQFNRDYLEEVREATLVLLYRLLFLFYAEDRNLLPVRDERYKSYSVRRMREEVRDKANAGTKFSKTMSALWLSLRGVFHLINLGDDDIGMPAYNGGLFDRARSPLLERTIVADAVIAPIIDALSRRTEGAAQGWINYRDLSVSHLGGIYERLLEYTLEHEVQAQDNYKDKLEINRITAQPASFARKVSGSYYTHDDLVRLILRESVGLLATERLASFDSHVKRQAKKASLNPGDWDALDKKDPASSLLELKICDPAMGSGHFLVALVDDMADRVLEAMESAAHLVSSQRWAAHLAETGRPWQSPVLSRIADIRRSIKTTAREHGWAVTDAQLDDRHIVRRMILKKCIFGVDKNVMAVELAKTALWLHTFTVGAPLSFLDHHLRCGDSLHGERLPTVQRNIQQLGALLMQSEFDRLQLAAINIAQVADLTDVDIAEANLSKQLAAEAAANVRPIHAVLDFWRALRWLVPGWPVSKIDRLAKLLKTTDADENATLQGLVALLNPSNNLVAVLSAGQLDGNGTGAQAANELMARARELAKRENFFHWWTSFPTVFDAKGAGGFDAVIGNPPWDRIKLQEVEWFAERDLSIAAQPRAADRKRMIEQLRTKKATLWDSYVEASERAVAAARVLGNGKLGSDDYPLLGGGDINLYSLFVERAQALVSATGVVALLTPSGIAADKGAAEFFRSISGSGRLGALFDFENRKAFFPDVDSRFKFCTLVFAGKERVFSQTRCAFFLHKLDELDDPARTLVLTAEDFNRVNPNTGAAPIFRNRRDADLTLAIYSRLPVLVEHGKQSDATGTLTNRRVWAVKYLRMFDMTNDSHLFLKSEELTKQGYEPHGLNRWVDDAGTVAVPLYGGRMIHHYDHRHANIVVNEDNLQNAAFGSVLTPQEKLDPSTFPKPQYWVKATDIPPLLRREWVVAFRDIARATDVRTMIAAIVPMAAVGNTLPLLLGEANDARSSALLIANLNSFVFDYVARQKAQTTHLNWYIVEQLPVITPERFTEPLPLAFVQAMRNAKLMNGHHASPTVADFVIPQVLALSYTAHDMAAFAADLGYVDELGGVLPPFVWDATERRARLAALDGLFFFLYGLSADDAGYVMDSFPIVRDQDTKAFGSFRTKEQVLENLTLLLAPN